MIFHINSNLLIRLAVQHSECWFHLDDYAWSAGRIVTNTQKCSDNAMLRICTSEIVIQNRKDCYWVDMNRCRGSSSGIIMSDLPWVSGTSSHKRCNWRCILDRISNCGDLHIYCWWFWSERHFWSWNSVDDLSASTDPCPEKKVRRIGFCRNSTVRRLRPRQRSVLVSLPVQN